MLNSVSNYLSERRAGFVRSAGVAGGLYLVGQYAAARVADMRESVLENRGAREKYVQVCSLPPYSPIVDIVPRSMRKRFQQNRQDISFTIMTYLPLLSKHILDDMDVEALTAELQSLSRAAKAPRIPRAVGREQRSLPPPHRQPSPRADSLESSVELVRASDAQSETSSASYISMSPATVRSHSAIFRSIVTIIRVAGHLIGTFCAPC
jgi:peroxin-3